MALKMTTSRRNGLVVALHDVWPGNFVQIDRDLQWLRAEGAWVSALLVVPYYHGQIRLSAAPAFLEWLRSQREQGVLILAHGYRHVRAELCGESMARSLFGRWINGRVQNEGEFTGLSASDTSDLLRRSLDLFAQAKIEPDGFAFPTWMGRLPPGFGWPASCRFFEGRLQLRELQGNRRRWAPPLTFGRDAKTQRLFSYGGRLWLRFLRRQKLVRLALHPGDLEAPAARDIVQSLVRGGEPITYAQALGEN